MGFGHRVYKNFDPRAKLMRKVCGDVLTRELGLQNDRLFKLAMELERSPWKTVLRREEALPERRLLLRHRAEGDRHPDRNVHLHLRAGPYVGWMTQWEEMITDPEYKIGRPRQLYIGRRPRRRYRWPSAVRKGRGTNGDGPPLFCMGRAPEDPAPPASDRIQKTRTTGEAMMTQLFRTTSYLFGGNAPFVEELYENYLDNPGSVSDEWRDYFDKLQMPGAGAAATCPRPVIAAFAEHGKGRFPSCPPSSPQVDDKKQVGVLQLINAYRFSAPAGPTSIR